jgi:hypothetical protein
LHANLEGGIQQRHCALLCLQVAAGGHAAAAARPQLAALSMCCRGARRWPWLGCRSERVAVRLPTPLRRLSPQLLCMRAGRELTWLPGCGWRGSFVQPREGYHPSPKAVGRMLPCWLCPTGRNCSLSTLCCFTAFEVQSALGPPSAVCVLVGPWGLLPGGKRDEGPIWRVSCLTLRARHQLLCAAAWVRHL